MIDNIACALVSYDENEKLAMTVSNERGETLHVTEGETEFRAVAEIVAPHNYSIRTWLERQESE